MDNTEKSNLERFAEDELSRIEKDEEGLQEVINEHILKMVQLFSDEGHSGFSANYAINILNRLLRFMPLTPIEDNPEDWSECREGVYHISDIPACSKIKIALTVKPIILMEKCFQTMAGRHGL